MGTFKKDDVVKFKAVQDFGNTLPAHSIVLINESIRLGTCFKVTGLYTSGGKQMLLLESLLTGKEHSFYGERFELANLAVPAPIAVPVGWGAAAPVTSHTGRKITDAERKLIELRIATRRALHGGD